MLHAMAVLLFATTINIDMRHLPDGAKETRVEGSRHVTVVKAEGKTIVWVKEGPRVDTILLSREGDRFRVETRSSPNAPRLIVPDRPAVIVDGLNLEPWLSGTQGSTSLTPQPRPERSDADAWPQYYVCPKDEAVLRVPRAHGNVETYHCPLDGTPMKRGTGPKSQYWLLE